VFRALHHCDEVANELTTPARDDVSLPRIKLFSACPPLLHLHQKRIKPLLKLARQRAKRSIISARAPSLSACRLIKRFSNASNRGNEAHRKLFKDTRAIPFSCEKTHGRSLLALIVVPKLSDILRNYFPPWGRKRPRSQQSTSKRLATLAFDCVSG
jgi:hypothetical protein